MKSFLKKYLPIPEQFIDDFDAIIRERYNGNNQIIIDFDVAAKWIGKKSKLEQILLDEFEKNYDYIQEDVSNNHKLGCITRKKLLITPNCFRTLCTMSQTLRSRRIRAHFIAMEKLIRTYYQIKNNEMKEELIKLRMNQKRKTKNDNKYIIFLVRDDTYERKNRLNQEHTHINKLDYSNELANTHTTNNPHDVFKGE